MKSDNMNDELLKNFFITNNYSLHTRKNYTTDLRQYCEYYKMTLQELLMEAEKEENDGVRWKFSKLKSKLLEYRQFLMQSYSYRTIKQKIAHIMKFYRFYEIDVKTLPRINEKSVEKTPPIYFKDLPDKKIIREALKISNPRMTAIILFMCSSGCARRETLNLTIQDYIDALSDYLPRREMSINEIIDHIHDSKDIIPTFNVRRVKTNKFYTTYCSPEAVNAINAYLLTREDNMTGESPLFKIADDYIVDRFQVINDRLGLGRVGIYRRFRTHMLRKFHASALYNDGMSLDKVNDLQGKAKNQTDEVYFMTNPEDLKYEYIKHLPAVTINKDVEKLSIKSPEFVQMENENKQLKSKLDTIIADVDLLKKNYSNKK